MMPDTPVLLQALLGLASCVARSCPEGKKAFIFAGPEGKSTLVQAPWWCLEYWLFNCAPS